MLYLLFFFLACSVIYSVYLLTHVLAFKKLQPFEKELNTLPLVSVVVAMRNEEANIVKLIHALQDQEDGYPFDRYEVVLVDDFSTDHTVTLAQSVFVREGFNLKIIRPEYENPTAGKKHALTAGIREASGEIILTTDADCLPPPGWIAAMAQAFDENTAMVLGPVKMEYNENSFLQKFQALESAGLVLLAGAGAALNKAGLCNGGNLAYRKSVFEEAGGFLGVDKQASGDDLFLMQKIKRLNKYTLRFQKSNYALVSTPACQTFSDFKAQRLRWVSKNRSLGDAFQTFVMVSAYFAQTATLAAVGLAWFKDFQPFALAFILLKMSAEYFALKMGSQYVGSPRLIRSFDLIFWAYTLYVVVVGVLGSLNLKYEWKGRKVK